MRLCCLWIVFAALLVGDPFYYGSGGFRELKLFGVLHTRANINGNWIALDTKFVHANTRFRLLSLQGSCVVLENVESREHKKLCREAPKIIQE